MFISQDCKNYLLDSMVNGKLCRFDKKVVNVFISKITAPMPDYEKEIYYEIIKHAAKIWNNCSPVFFNFIDTQIGADIVIVWSKVGIKFEGMCKFRSIIGSEIKSVTIEIGLPNSNSPKVVNNDTILHTALHEFGHSLGLGHGVSDNDVMYVPHKKTLNSPSDNDIFILNFIYSNKIGEQYINLIQ